MDALCKRDSYRKVEYQYDHFVLFPDIRLISNSANIFEWENSASSYKLKGEKYGTNFKIKNIGKLLLKTAENLRFFDEILHVYLSNKFPIVLPH